MSWHDFCDEEEDPNETRPVKKEVDNVTEERTIRRENENMIER